MVAETSRRRAIVPAGQDRVKETLAQALQGSCAKAVGLSVQLTLGASFESLVEVCGRLVIVGDRTNVAVNWCLGDVYEFYPRYSRDRAAFIAEVERVLGKEYAERIRKCAMVSRWWPVHLRTNDHCWQWYMDHNPDGSKRSVRPKNIVELEEVDSRFIDGREVIRCKSPRGTVYILRRKTLTP